MKANQILEPRTLRLRGHRIRLADHSGRHILPVPVLGNQNQLLLSPDGRLENVVPSQAYIETIWGSPQIKRSGPANMNDG